MRKASKKHRGRINRPVSIRENRRASTSGHAFKSAPLSSIVIILLVSFAVYFNALFNGFVYDDEYQVLNNRWITDIRHIPDIFSSSVWSFQSKTVLSNYYRPLMHIVYMINYHVFGLNPLGFHLVNILFHAGVSVIVFLILSEIFGGQKSLTSVRYLSPPLIAALLFATHPVHTEAVTWVAGLPDVSFTFFYLLSFYFYMRSRGRLGSNYVFSVISFSFAAFFKEPALTLPLILAVYDYVFREAGNRLMDYCKRYVPYILLGGFYLLLRFYALRGFAPQQPRHAYLSTYQYVINVFPLFTQYLEKVLIPLNLNAFYVLHPIYSISDPKGLLSLAIMAFFVLAFFFLKKNKVALLGLSFLIVPLLPVFYIPALGVNTFAERYLYLPSVGFAILLALFLTWIRANSPRWTIWFTVISIALICIYSVGAVYRNAVWRDNYSLFSDTVKKSPDSVYMRNEMGNALRYKGRMEEALEQYQAGLKLDPNNALSYYNLGVVYYLKGMPDKAIEYFRTAVTLEPGFVLAHFNLGVALGSRGSTGEAEEQLLTASKLAPDFAEAHYYLGVLYQKKRMDADAKRDFEAAFKIKPELERTIMNRRDTLPDREEH